MRRSAGWAVLVLLLVAATSLRGQELVPVPRLSGPVVDQAGVLGTSERSALDALAQELEQKTGAEMV